MCVHVCIHTHAHTQAGDRRVSVGLSGIEAPASGTEKALCSGAGCPSRAGTDGPFQVAGPRVTPGPVGESSASLMPGRKAAKERGTAWGHPDRRPTPRVL